MSVSNKMAKTRQDTRLEQEEAEFLVLGHLLAEGLQAHKAYTRYPGYDIVVVDPEHELQCLVQVKSRWATDFDRRFDLKDEKPECDLFVFVALNRGRRFRLRRDENPGDDRRDPEYWIVPAETVWKSRDATRSRGQFHLNARWDEYKGARHVVRTLMDRKLAE